jgi:hypothetical protein
MSALAEVCLNGQQVFVPVLVQHHSKQTGANNVLKNLPVSPSQMNKSLKFTFRIERLFLKGSITDSMGSFNPYVFHRPERTSYSSPGQNSLSRTERFGNEGVSPWVVMEKLKSSALN